MTLRAAKRVGQPTVGKLWRVEVSVRAWLSQSIPEGPLNDNPPEPC